MKLATFLASFAIAGVDLVTASPTRTGHAADPAMPLLKGYSPHLTWDPVDAYALQPTRKFHWEQRCERALKEHGCVAGIVYQGETKRTRDGKITSYLNVEGAPSLGTEYPKKLHVFREGTSEDVTARGWSARAMTAVGKAKRLKKYAGPPSGQSQEGEALLSWDPVNAYSDQGMRKAYWERRCHHALANKGCRVGVIHQGESEVIRDGQTTSYVNVEGALSADTEHKKMRVFRDGSSEDGWSTRDWKKLREAKIRRWRAMQPHDSQNVLLSWDPVDAYDNQRSRKRAWSQRCEKALIKQGCRVATIHMGDIKVVRNGTKTSYVLVEAAPSPSMKKKKMRVFQDGTFEDVPMDTWSPEDGRSMRRSKRQKRRRIRMLSTDSMDTRTGTQAPTEDRISRDPPHADQSLSPHVRQALQEACDNALEREGCTLGTFPGFHYLKNSDGTKSSYMTGLAWKDAGTQERGASPGVQTQSADEHPRKRPRIQETTSGTGTRAHEASTSTQAPSQTLPQTVPVPSRPGRGELDLNFPPPDRR